MRDNNLTRANAIRFYAFAAGSLLLDQVTKAAARMALVTDRPVTVIPGFFDLELHFNKGAAFGLLPKWAPLLILVGLVAVFAIVRLRGAGARSALLSVGLGLLLGGAVGNLFDRLTTALGNSDSRVTDFLSFYITKADKIYAWPTFNLADAAIVMGAALTFYYVFVLDNARKQLQSNTPQDESGGS